MVSGTIANKRRAEEKRAAEIRKIKASVERNKELDKNREQVIAEVCALFGWKELDPFAKKMVDKAIAGQIVDIEQLKADIAAWKQAQETAVEETEEAVAEKEETVNGDISVQ